MKGIVQAVKRRMHKDDKLPTQESRSSSGAITTSEKRKGTFSSSSLNGADHSNAPTGPLSLPTPSPPITSLVNSSANSSLPANSPFSRTSSPTVTSFNASATTMRPATGSPIGSLPTAPNSPNSPPWPSRQPLDGVTVPNPINTPTTTLPTVDIDGIINTRGTSQPDVFGAGGMKGRTNISTSIPSISGNPVAGKGSEDFSSGPIMGLSPDNVSGEALSNVKGFNGNGSGVTFPVGMSFEGSPFTELPSFRETPQNKRLELFRKKLQLCCIVFDFTIPNAYVKEKELKRTTLVELVEYVNNAMASFNEQVIGDVVNMVTLNIFRTLPPTASTFGTSAVYEPEEDEPRLEAAWPHLQVVYEFFRRFVVSPDTDCKIAKRHIDQTFILKLLRLFNSEDPRERDYLKTILHRIYGKIMAMRSFIRKSIQHLFFETVYEREIQHGTAELLEILGSIVNGFALPLKEEHKLFLEKALIPLHKPRNFLAYHQYLSYCMSQYVEKDSRLAEQIVRGLLKFWPVTNTAKEVLFINEIEEILELTQMPEFQRIMVPLFQKLAQCIQSSHFQVAERVLFLWNNDHVVKMINDNRVQLFPIVIKALYKNSKDHWNTTVNGLTYNVSKLLAQADPVLFDDCSDRHISNEEKQKQHDNQRQQFWSDLQIAYDQKKIPN